MPRDLDVALVTCLRLPEPDPDAAPLERALREAGLRAAWLAWDDEAADFSRARLTLLRSTWNYYRRTAAFAAWAAHAAQVSRLWNPLPVVRWNMHKSYLLDLERSGVPIVPTELVARGAADTLDTLMERRGWADVVIKPAISGASFRTMRVGRRGDEQGERHFRALVADRDVLVQSYLPSVETWGERALVWSDGELTHAVRKSPRFAGERESVSPVGAIPPAERECALRAVAAVDHKLLYARIDLAPGPDGTPCVMEVELIEPSLFFEYGPGSVERLVAALRRRL